jgi:phage tail sheath protein FI
MERMAFNIGINVLETDGKAVPSIVGAATSVGAFLVRATRGVPNVVYRLSSMSQFKEAFGPPLDGSFGYYAVKGFFDNGGSVAYVLRIADGAVAAPAAHTYGADLTVTAGYLGTVDPGLWGDDVSTRVIDNASVAGAYDLVVRYRGVVVEQWERLSNAAAPAAPARGVEAAINDPSSGSKYIRVTKLTTSNPAATATFDALTGGADDTMNAAAVDTAVQNGWNAFDAFDVQLLTCPETNSNTVVAAALTYCSNRGDCMYVGYTSQNDALGAAKAYGAALRANKVYGAVYFPWIQVAAETGGLLFVPPVGHVMGVYARTEGERGIWKAPAGVQAQVKGAVGLRQMIGDIDHTDLVKNGNVNALRFVSGAGIIVDSSRTLSTNPLWYYVNVRLLFNFVKTSLRQSLRWVVQEPNSTELWQKVKINSVTPFLMGLWRKGAFGPGAPGEVFTVKCDADNNPPANIQQGIFTVEVYFYPSRPAETVVIVVGQQEGGGTAKEA